MFGLNRKPRQFSYNPRYYDAELEARNQRRIELGHAPIERSEDGQRKPGDLLRARSEMRQHKAQQEMANRRKSNMLRGLFVLLLIAGFIALLMSIKF